MATLTTGDIKTVDELAEISKDELANEDSLLTFDKDMNCHKKFLVSALRAWILENERESGEAAAAAEAAAEAAAASATAAASSAASAASALADLSGQATLAESYAVGGTGTRSGEDTDNASYYASQASGSATAAATSATNAASSEANAATSESNAADSAALAESYAVGGTDTRTGEDTDNAKYYAEEAEAALHKIRLFDNNAALLVGVRGETLNFWNKSDELVTVDAVNETLVI